MQEGPILTEDLAQEAEEFVLRTGRLATSHIPEVSNFFVKFVLLCNPITLMNYKYLSCCVCSILNFITVGFEMKDCNLFHLLIL